MCLILLSKPSLGDYKFVLTSNRDEFYERKTKNMFWWNNVDGLLAGQDLEQGGTWLGITKSGRFAAVTNVREFYQIDKKENFLSRGDLVKNFLNSSLPPEEYVQKVEANKYMGFNLVVSDLKYFSIISSQGIESFNQELVVVGNRALNTETKKLNNAKEDFKSILNQAFTHQDLIELMQKPKKNYEFNLEQINQNHGSEFDSRFITSDIYGTRSTTVITIDRKDTVKVTEVIYDSSSNLSDSNIFEFKVHS
mgnify:FL=1